MELYILKYQKTDIACNASAGIPIMHVYLEVSHI